MQVLVRLVLVTISLVTLGIYIDELDNIYVVDNVNDRIQILDTSGNFIAHWGVSGINEGEFDNPYGYSHGF